MSESDSGCPPCCGRVACELRDVSDWEIDDYILHPLHPLERVRLEYRVNSTVPSIVQMNIGVLCGNGCVNPCIRYHADADCLPLWCRLLPNRVLKGFSSCTDVRSRRLPDNGWRHESNWERKSRVPVTSSF